MFQRKRGATGAPSGKEEEPKEVAWLIVGVFNIEAGMISFTTYKIPQKLILVTKVVGFRGSWLVVWVQSLAWSLGFGALGCRGVVL